MQVMLTCGSEGTGARWNHSEQKANFPHGMLTHPSNTPGKWAKICPFQAKSHFLLSFCLSQGDTGIQGYPGRKVRREAPVLLNEISALMLSGIRAENLWVISWSLLGSCAPAQFATGPQIPCCHLCKESLGTELSVTPQQLWNKHLPLCVPLYTHFQAEMHFLCIQIHMGG